MQHQDRVDHFTLLSHLAMVIEFRDFVNYAQLFQRTRTSRSSLLQFSRIRCNLSEIYIERGND
jgi:hypothetical protein